MIITISTTIKYGNYQHLQQAVETLLLEIRKHWSKFQQAFDYHKDFELVIRPIRGKFFGRALQQGKKIEIDPRYSLREAINTLAHELVHSEQFKQGRLKTAPLPFHREWEGTLFKPVNSKIQYDKYRSLPWEKEAWDRAENFVNKHWPK